MPLRVTTFQFRDSCETACMADTRPNRPGQGWTAQELNEAVATFARTKGWPEAIMLVNSVLGGEMIDPRVCPEQIPTRLYSRIIMLVARELADRPNRLDAIMNGGGRP